LVLSVTALPHAKSRRPRRGVAGTQDQSSRLRALLREFSAQGDRAARALARRLDEALQGIIPNFACFRVRSSAVHLTHQN